MAGYATYELATRLAALSPQQRAAIGRIVQHVYIQNQPLADLLRGADKICSERRYYGHGRIDPETGGWLTPPGWNHDKSFQDALSEAVRLALQVRSREELQAIGEAKRRSRLATPGVVDELIAIATKRQPIQVRGETRIINRFTEDRDSIAAAKTLLDYADPGPDAASASPATDDAADWWKAAGDE